MEVVMPLISQQAIPAKAAIKGHPLHPLLVTLPIGCLVGVLATDIAFRITLDAFWPTASFHLLVAGLITGAVAALAGLTDFLARPAIRRINIAWFHFFGNGLALVLAAVNLVHRMPDHAAPIMGGGIMLSLLVVAIFLVTGWLGGELVFRHRVGVMLADAANSASTPSVDRPQAANAAEDLKRTGTL
jgi:uncharacterized membrane protein